jgi:hypothetical protein
MVSAVEKSSSSKREKTSKPEENVADPVISLSVPLKEVTVKTAKTADKALDWELCGAEVIQHEPVSGLEYGMSLSQLCLDRNGYTYSPDASFFNVSPPSD